MFLLKKIIKRTFARFTVYSNVYKVDDYKKKIALNTNYVERLNLILIQQEEKKIQNNKMIKLFCSTDREFAKQKPGVVEQKQQVDNRKKGLFMQMINSDLNYRLYLYLCFVMLIEKKYFQFFFFFNNNKFLLNFSKDLIVYLINKLQQEIEINLFVIQKGFSFNDLNYINSMQYLLAVKESANISYDYFNLNKWNNNSNLYNYFNVYKNLEFFEKNYACYYLKSYFKFLFFQKYDSFVFKSQLFSFSFKCFNKRYELINYNLVRQLFLKFFNLILNSIMLNTIPFFIPPKYLENEVYLFYSYILFVRTAVLYNNKYFKWLLLIRNFNNFQINFGTPCFFFILDIMHSFLTVSSLKEYNVPIGALTSPGMNLKIFDYPLCVFSQSKSNIYLFFFFIMRLVFFGLIKKKKIYWSFFIKYQIIYELKKKLINI